MAAEALPAILQKYSAAIGPVLPLDLNGPAVCRLDFSAENSFWQDAALEDTAGFEALVQELLRAQNATVGVGGYLEDRVIYRRSNHFTTASEKRTIHLGVDVWLPAFTPVLAPLNGRVHSFRNNNNFGDYGPCIILEHDLENQIFYTLYGHLTHSSLRGLAVGQQVNKGEAFAQVGPFPENGDWPPHLHFQIITNMLGLTGDFPGVCALSQLTQFKQICPNPNLVLKCKYLN
ncbi:MAG: peptidoglycan DD-metalloendopeptidase family protein [Adhaeribacter sp.]